MRANAKRPKHCRVGDGALVRLHVGVCHGEAAQYLVFQKGAEVLATVYACHVREAGRAPVALDRDRARGRVEHSVADANRAERLRQEL